jgi:hypothetical protein
MRVDPSGAFLEELEDLGLPEKKEKRKHDAQARSSKKTKTNFDTDLSKLESAKYGAYPMEGDEMFDAEFWREFGPGVMMIRELEEEDSD